MLMNSEGEDDPRFSDVEVKVDQDLQHDLSTKSIFRKTKKALLAQDMKDWEA